MKAFSKERQRSLFDGRKVSAVLPYASFDQNPSFIQGGMGRLSISGAQEKYGIVEENSLLRLSTEQEHARYILKPAPYDRRFLYRADMPANECLTMDIAQEVYHIPAAPRAICYFGNGEAAYLTKRFDYNADGKKYKVEDFASAAKVNKDTNGEDYKYTARSYEECVEMIREHCIAAEVEVLKFFRLLLFNYLFSNGDAHLKNFTFIEYREGDVRLSPAYDLLNTNLHLPSSIFALEKGLFKEGTPITDTTPIGRPLFLHFGRRIQLSEKMLQRELEYFSADHAKTKELIENSLLSPDAKHAYLLDYKYRLSTLQ